MEINIGSNYMHMCWGFFLFLLFLEAKGRSGTSRSMHTALQPTKNVLKHDMGEGWDGIAIARMVSTGLGGSH